MAFFDQLGILSVTWGSVVMWLIALTLIYLAISKQYEPLLLLPIGFGILVANLPLTGLMTPGEGLIWRFYHYGVEWEIIPPLIFLGLGAHTDFGPLLSQPRLIFLGAAAQGGVYVTFFAAHAFGFTLEEAATIGIIGGADGPTTIYLTAKLAPDLLGAVAVAAYSYMALVPVIQPPIIKLLTTQKEREIDMPQARPVSKTAVVVFPIATCVLTVLFIPASGPLIGMLMFGNLIRESGVTQRLSSTASGPLINIVTIFLGLIVGATMEGEKFLKPDTLAILALGMVAFCFSTAGGVVFAKVLNLFLGEGKKINPCIGAAGVSAVPMASRVVQNFVSKHTDGRVNPLMAAMGPNVAGVIGSAVSAGVFLSLIKALQ